MSENNRWAQGGPCIRMRDGGRVYLGCPDERAFQVERMAYHLAGINRYTGGSRLSVAQHMVVGAEMARRFYPQHPLLPRRFMVHDTVEHILNDMSSPLKAMIPSYKELETQWDFAAERRFGTLFVGVPEVKELDDRMWITERLTVFGHLPGARLEEIQEEDCSRTGLSALPVAHNELWDWFEPWSPRVAEEEYLVAFRKYLPEVAWSL